jgi:hypothetical protein
VSQFTVVGTGNKVKFEFPAKIIKISSRYFGFRLNIGGKFEFVREIPPFSIHRLRNVERGL